MGSIASKILRQPERYQQTPADAANDLIINILFTF
jgi:hypothetical protein